MAAAVQPQRAASGHRRLEILYRTVLTHWRRSHAELQLALREVSCLEADISWPQAQRDHAPHMSSRVRDGDSESSVRQRVGRVGAQGADRTFMSEPEVSTLACRCRSADTQRRGAQQRDLRRGAEVRLLAAELHRAEAALDTTATLPSSSRRPMGARLPCGRALSDAHTNASHDCHRDTPTSESTGHVGRQTAGVLQHSEEASATRRRLSVRAERLVEAWKRERSLLREEHVGPARSPGT